MVNYVPYHILQLLPYCALACVLRDDASNAPAHPTRFHMWLSPSLTPANHLAVLLCVKVGDQSVRDERDGSGGRMA